MFEEYGKYDRLLLEKLVSLELDYLVKPVQRLIKRNKAGMIKVHNQTWKQIMREVFTGDKFTVESIVLSYLAHYGIHIKNPYRVDMRDSKDRVKKHRKKLKEEGYKTISFSVSNDDYIKINMLKEYWESPSYASLFLALVDLPKVPEDFKEDYMLRAKAIKDFVKKSRGYSYKIPKEKKVIEDEN